MPINSEPENWKRPAQFKPGTFRRRIIGASLLNRQLIEPVKKL
jgi:hypothetical protein